MVTLKNNKYIWILFAAVAVIWGIIISRVFVFFTNDDIESDNSTNIEDRIIERNTTSNSEQKSDFEYIKLNRDPFSIHKSYSHSQILPKIINKKTSETTIAPLKLNYKINGVIISAGRKVVIFEDLTDNKTLFLKEGDNYKNIIIKEIHKKTVSLTEADEFKEIAVQ